MNEDSVMTEEERIQEELVAYLDGELEAAAGERVERRLVDDPAYRNKLKELQSAWDLLDELPRAHVNDSFTESTVAMVALSAAADVQEAKNIAQRRNYAGVAIITLSLLVAAGLGYTAVAGWYDKPNQELVRDLPVIENIDLYRVADNVEFLRRLDDSGLFEEEQTDVP